MDTENFLLTIGKNEIINSENFIISDVFHCVDTKTRPVSICNIKYDNKYLLLEMPFLKVIKKEDNFIYLLIEDDNIKKDLNNIDDILFKLIDNIEDREDCCKEFDNLLINELVYNTLLKTNEDKTYIKIYYNNNTKYINKGKNTSIFNVDIDDMVQVILFIENIRIYTNDNFCILKNLAQQVVIHKPIKIYNSPKINLEKINISYNENNIFKKQIIEDVSKTIMEENSDNSKNDRDSKYSNNSNNSDNSKISNNNNVKVNEVINTLEHIIKEADIVKVEDVVKKPIKRKPRVLKTTAVNNEINVVNKETNVIVKEPIKRKPRVLKK